MSGNLMLRVDPQVHANAAIAGELAGKSLNQWAEEIIRRKAASKRRSRSKSAA
jgi:predicted HicB family RNase H-like nuclease